MQKVDPIGDFVLALSHDIRPAEKPIIEHIGIIIRQWCRKYKYEISWVSLDGKIGNDKVLYHKIYLQFVDDIVSKVVIISSYVDYKKHIVLIADGLIQEGFKCFNRLLIEGCNSAWKNVAELLRVYTIVWLNNRGLSMNYSFDDLHHQSLITLYEKISQKKLVFADSCELKSYYFRILENKSREEHRKVVKSRRFTDILPELYDTDMHNRPDERLGYIKDQIERLDGMEKRILSAYFVQEKKLAEIAGELQITAENCRVIKHRAMKRLINLFTGKQNRTTL